MSPERADFWQDPPGDAAEFKFHAPKHPIMLHLDAQDEVSRAPNLRKRLGLVLQHLAAHGRTSVVKGCAGVNRGWRRSPLGGNRGMQFYLWWTPDGGGGPASEMGANQGRIWARAAMHHDDHTPLSIGNEGDYLPIAQKDLSDANEPYVGLPDTDEQRNFVRDSSPVRVVLGHPGSGKTTALWKAVEARSGQNVLYASWSRELVNLAQERFQAFAPSNVDVYGLDFRALLGVILGRDVPPVSYEESLAAFKDALVDARLSPAEMGAWSARPNALYAETRAILLGRAVPGENGEWITAKGGGKLARLTDAEYMRQRGGGNGVGENAARAMLKIAERLGRLAAAALLNAFPELAAAAEAVERLKTAERLPSALSTLDRVAVDEVQDMTLAETAAIAELCLAIQRRKRAAPFLLIAGDEGQTVRPSGFEWGRLKRLINERIARPVEFTLDETLRSPRQIAEVEERASALYVKAGLPQVRRPGGQRNIPGGDAVNARLFYVNAPNQAEAATLLERLDEIPDLAVIAPERNAPDWLPDNLKNMVLTPAAVKGLEYQTACVLEPGRTLNRLVGEMDADAAELEAQSRRTAIDGLRVALSRATENLAFIDVGADDAIRRKSANLLGDSTIYSPDEILDYLENMDMDAESAVLQRMREARDLMDSSPGRAWQLACQAVNRLGSSGASDAVADDGLRTQAHTTLLRIAARIMVDGTPPRVERRDVASRANDVIGDMGSESARDGFARLEEWTANRAAPPFGLLDATAALGDDGDWLRNALQSNLQTLLNSLELCAEDADAADEFSGDVETWLDLCEYADDRADHARELRRMAAKTLIASDRAERAGPVIERINPQDLRLSALFAEKTEKWDEAIELYGKIGAPDEVRRVEKAAAKSCFDKGTANLENGDVDAAIDDFTNATRFDADYRDAHYYRGAARLRKGDLDLAISDFSEVARIHPDDAQAYSKRGFARMRKGELDAAIADFTNAISVSPNFAEAYLNRADAYSRKAESDRENADRIGRGHDPV